MSHYFFTCCTYIVNLSVKSDNVYLASRIQRLIYHFGGPAVDFILFTSYSLIGFTTKNTLFFIFAVSSFQSFIFNLMPFGLSDGYFIMSVLFKIVNLRINFINLISFKWKQVDFSIFYVIYYIVSFIFIIEAANITSFWISGILSDFIVISAPIRLIRLAITFILVLQLIIVSYFRSKNSKIKH